MIRSVRAALLGTVLLAGPVAAQQADRVAAGLATAVEGLGQSFGKSAMTGDSVFVTATGRTPISGARLSWYGTNIEGRAESAVAAAKLRDSRLAAIEAQARRFGVDFAVEGYLHDVYRTR